MNIAYLSGTIIPSTAASALHAVKMSQALAQLGHLTTLYAFRNKSTPASPDTFFGMDTTFRNALFSPPPLPRGWGHYFAAACKLHNLWLPMSDSADAYYGRHSRALLAASRTGKPFAYEAHILPHTESARNLELKLLRRSNLRALVCISKTLADDYRHSLNPDVPIHVLHDAADAVVPSKPQTLPSSAWPGRRGALQIGYVGHLYRGKGLELIEKIVADLPEMDFHIIGGRDAEISAWRNRIPQKNVHFHGYVPHGQIGSYYEQLDIALLPNQARVAGAASDSEIGRWTSPLKAFEYMSMALPIIASEIAPLLEIFRDRDNALIAKHDCGDDWVAHLKELQNTPSLREQLGRNARRDFEQSYTWDIRAQKVVQLLQ